MSYPKTKLMNLEDGQTLLAAVDGKMSDLKNTIEESKADIINVTDSTSESVKTLTDGADGVPIGVTFAVEPVQDLHGQDFPFPPGAFNLIPDGTDTSNGYVADKYLASSGSTYSNELFYVSEFFPVSAETEYTLSLSGSALNSQAVCFYDSSKGYLSGQNFGNQTSRVITTPANAAFARCTQYKDSSNGIIQLEKGTTATTPRPYKNICPIYGWTEGKLTGTGKNLLTGNYTWTQAIRGDDGTSVSNPASHYTEPIYHIEPNKEYTLSGNLVGMGTQSAIGFRVYFLKADGSWISRTTVKNSAPFTFTTPSNCGAIQIQVATELTLSDAMLEIGQSASPYEPFGTTYTIQFGSTIYGGTLTVNKDGTGSINVDKVIETIPTITSLNTSAGGIKYAYFTTQHTIEYHANDGIRVKCENFKSCTYETRGEPFTAYLGGPNQVVIFFDTDTTIEQANAYVNGSKILLYLIGKWSDHSTTLPLTTSQVKSLLGVNNLYADTGDILSVDYSADTKLYVDGQIADKISASQRLMELIVTANREDGMKATKAYSAGDLLIVNGTLYKASTSIANGATLTVGTNITATTVAGELAALA